ncbi:MAG: carbohydrate-binding domain-containing protein [Clostridia bacterium]|nr:carbohydrate-binding domain-containing protein [Clostridia bacterium]
MKNKKTIITSALSLFIVLSVLSSCGHFSIGPGFGSDIGSSVITSGGNGAQSSVTGGGEPTSDPPKDAESERVEITGDFTIVSSDGNSVTASGNAFRITSAGSYVLSGKLEGGFVEIDAGKDGEVELILSGASITCSVDSPIKCINAEKLTVKAAEGSFNEIVDLRSLKETDDDTKGEGAVYSTCDMNINGKGSLVITAGYNNGIHCKDDLKIKNVTLKVVAPNNALKGNDSVTVESGEIILISSGGDGIKTENTDVSSKGNQRGTVTVAGGRISISSACDGIDAAYDFIMENGAELTVKTATYAETSGEPLPSTGTSSTDTELNLIVPTSMYSDSIRYAALFYNDDMSAGVWADASYSSAVYSGRTQYAGLVLRAPTGYSHVAFYRFAAGSRNSVSEYQARTDGERINTSMNAYLVTSASGSSMNGDWANLQKGSSGGGRPGAGGSKNTEKTAYSSKGIKAGNSVILNGGTIVIFAKDDGIHANGGETLENGLKSAGNVTVAGGSIEITSADDGIHADSVLMIGDGYVNIIKAHEGLEGNTIDIKGGEIYVYATDDGINAGSGTSKPSINISGGHIEVTTSSGDTDGIDSNGTYTQTGGFVLIRGGNAQGNVAGSLDTDGTVKVTGGTLIALGGICELPASGSSPVVKMQRKSFPAGEYIFGDAEGNVIAAFRLESGYTSCWICSDSMKTGGSYQIVKDGSVFASWKQSSASVTAG